MNTERIYLQPLNIHDSHFILDLLNTKGWLEFIGDRKVNSLADATSYIQKVNDQPSTRYWTVRQSDTKRAIGIITLIKRDYLAHHDIGFAFLPQYFGNGYALEASSAFLKTLRGNDHDSVLHAITIPHNKPSIKLLIKLGFALEREIRVDQETLQLYTRTARS